MVPYTKRLIGPPLLPATPDVSLDATGLVALAELRTIQQRTALTGTAALLDVLVLCPGIHTQQHSPALNGGEYPACAAMTTGYVFRIENPATVYYLQQVGRTGHLITLSVSQPLHGGLWFSYGFNTLFTMHNSTTLSSIAYWAAVLWAIAVLILLGFAQDWWGLVVVLLLMFARLCNVVVIRRRAVLGWTGAKEPGVQGDLLVLPSQDRWIRIRGAVDDLKSVTSGQWLRDPTIIESWVTALATVVIYLNAALVSNATQFGKILLLALLIGSAGLLAIANVATHDLQMHGIVMKVAGDRKSYERRLDLANELIEETGRDDWAKRLGMTVNSTPQDGEMSATM